VEKRLAKGGVRWYTEEESNICTRGGEPMTLILCVDDRGGLSFNGRRQSQDRRVREDLLTMAAGGALWMDDYSRRQFTEPEAAAIRVDRDPAARAAEGDGLCLLELQDPEAALERADRLGLYRWGRHYPADRRLDLPPAGWRLEGQTEFPGRSHDMITKEIYVK